MEEEEEREEGRRGYRTKNKKPTRQCGEKKEFKKKYSQFFVFDPLVSSFFLPHAMSEMLSLPSKYQYFFDPF